MTDIEIPLGKRTPQFRFFEILPAALSYGAIILLVVMSLLNPLAAAIFVLLLVIIMFVKAVAMAYRTIQGYIVYRKTQKVNWARRLAELENPAKFVSRYQNPSKSVRREYGVEQHRLNLAHISEISGEFPKPSQIYHAVFVFIYKENYDVVAPTIEALLGSDYDPKRIYLILAYEQRGGAAAQDTVDQLMRQYRGKFRDIVAYQHPDNLPDEVAGKGPNATYAGRKFASYVKKRKIDPNQVIVTTLDADNRVDPKYLPYLTYEWIVTPNRQRVSFQPICLFTNNIWDVPAPMRVVATGNSFWNVISSMRPHLLRNFASHAQGLSALIGMDFWSKRTIVEDGHQYWRSYFYFDGDYSVVPLRISIGQDAVLSDTYLKSLKAQFIQVRRWAYGASDVAYVAKNLWRRDRTTKFLPTLARFWRLLDSHVTQAIIAPIVAFGGWLPLLINPDAQLNYYAHELPMVVGSIQQVAMVGLLITLFTSLAMLPPRPQRYRKGKHVLMVLQWVLMPVTSLAYASASAYYSQTRLLLARYFTVFETTEKNIIRK
ncbi:MAG: hypothetical protein LBC95_02780 [Candidatus Nomurabacteria bacterium]|jgi:cellulose synthase/poly-beta-1,6-N-acetylglucosamine synthase-like glycosyltransferase|nr:hypothetical protein [Candidatus Nomurabacteria bacterium]